MEHGWCGAGCTCTLQLQRAGMVDGRWCMVDGASVNFWIWLSAFAF
jgi:hypothetical protein